jgi:hypothetical protein
MTVWVRSERSMAEGDNCVEAAADVEAESVWVRNSKVPDGPAVCYTRAEWEAFLAGARAGEFDWDRLAMGYGVGYAAAPTMR